MLLGWLRAFCIFSGISLSTAGGYFYDGTHRTWENARLFCNDYDGIATILTATDRQNARNTANANSWIGLNDLTQNGNWIWSDGASCKVTTGHHCSDFWGPSEPNANTALEHCVEYVRDSQGTFNDKDCSTTLPVLCNIPTSDPTETPTKNPTQTPITSAPTFDPTNAPTQSTANPSAFPTKSPTNHPTSDPTIDDTKYEITYGVTITIHLEYTMVTNTTNTALETLLQNNTKSIINQILRDNNLTDCIQSHHFDISTNDTMDNNVTLTTIVSTIFFCDNYEENTLSVTYVQQTLDTDFIRQFNGSDILTVKPNSVIIEVDTISIRGKEIDSGIIGSTIVTVSYNTKGVLDKKVSNKDMILAYIVIAITVGLFAMLMVVLVVFYKKYRLKRKLLKRTSDVIMENIVHSHSNIEISPSKTMDSNTVNTDDLNINEEGESDVGEDLFVQSNNDAMETKGKTAGSIYAKPKLKAVKITRGNHQNRAKSIDEDMYNEHSHITTNSALTSNSTTAGTIV